MRCAVLVGVLAAVSAPFAAWAGDDAGGFTNRIEKEYKLDVPPALLEQVWDYLRLRYADPAKLGIDFGGAPSIRTGDEYFIDVYFDDSTLSLHEQSNGVRHRTRYVFSDSSSAKHGRQLLQVKMSKGEKGAVARTEVKFDVDPVAKPVTEEDRHPLFGLVEPDERPRLRETIRQVGVEADDLRPTIELKQRRRRVYLNVDGHPLVTITLDEVSSSKWLREVSFVEIEMELNEVAYTDAAPAERDRMSAVLEAMKADLFASFPQIRQDQTPKYSKAFHRLEEKFMLFPVMVRMGFPIEGLLGLGVVGVGALGFGLKRRRGDGEKRG